MPAPSATNLSQALDFTEDQGPVDLDDIVVTDADPGDTVTATLRLMQPSAGALTTSGGASYDAATGEWSITGSVDEVNAALAAVSVTLATDWEENFTIVTSIRDADGGGPADGLITLSGSGVNDAPVATAPARINLPQNVATDLTGLSFSDVDAEPDPVTVTLAVAQGSLEATSGGGVTVGGTSTALTLHGGVEDINAFIAGGGVAYTPVADTTGAVTLTVTIDDGGFNGGGGAQTDTAAVILKVGNTAPVIAAGSPPRMADNEEDAGPPVNGSTAGSTLVSSLLGDASDADGDALGIAVQGVGLGKLWYSLDDGATWTQAPVVSTSSALLLDGSARIYIEPAPNIYAYNATAITFRAWDQATGVSGGTASVEAAGGSTAFSTTPRSARIDVTSVNDPPVITGTNAIAITLGQPGVLKGFGFSDPDADSASVKVTFSVDSGRIEGPSAGGVTASGSGTSTMTISGSWYDVRQYISGDALKYVPAGPGTVAMTVTATDQGNAGAGGDLTATKTITLHIGEPAPVTKQPPPPMEGKVIDGVLVGMRETVEGGHLVRETEIPTVKAGQPDQLHLDPLDRVAGTLPPGTSLRVKSLVDPPAPGDVLSALQIGLGQQDEIVTSKAFAEQVERLSQPESNIVAMVLSIVMAALEGQQTSSPLILEGKVRGPGEGPSIVTIDTGPGGGAIELQNLDLVVIRGQATLTGGAGPQVVFGDAAAQRIILGAGDDVLYGGGGDDVVGSETGADTLFGDAGQDTVFGGEGEDHLWGGEGDDHVQGNQGTDFVHGAQGADTLHGGQGDDVVRGGQGGDIAFGDLGVDTLFGDLGNDTLSGGAGDDVLTGGAGADLFLASEGVDRILDFNAWEGDRLRLEAGANPTLRQEGADAVVDLGEGRLVVLQGVSLAGLPDGWMLLG